MGTGSIWVPSGRDLMGVETIGDLKGKKLEMAV